MELPFRKLEVLEPTYLEGVTRLLSEKRKKKYVRKVCKIPKLLAKYHPASLSKGQLISKCPIGVFKSPKRPTKFIPVFLS